MLDGRLPAPSAATKLFKRTQLCHSILIFAARARQPRDAAGHCLTQDTMTQRSEPNYRTYATALTLGAALVLFAIGFVLQLVVYELRSQYHDNALPAISKPLFDWFGLRPTSYLLQITFWFWWLFLGNLLHAACFYAENRQFVRVFAFRYLVCCVSVACYLSIVALMAAMPQVILLADLDSPPDFTRVVSIVSVVLPIALAVLAAGWVYQTSRIIRDSRGRIRVVHSAPVNAESLRTELVNGRSDVREAADHASRPHDP